jgi:hypothetical protein
VQFIGEKPVRNISGMVFRTYSELDILQLSQVNKDLKDKRKIKDIDHETILSTFEGHTIFSIYFDDIRVYEAILE